MQKQSPSSSENIKIILIGYMGSGKSSIGKALAEKLNLPFMDLDMEIEKREGKSISEVFSDKGEIYFRKRENQVLKEILSQTGNFVLATGGGTPCYADSLSFMIAQEDTRLVYLKVSLPTLTTRLMADKDNRPLLAHLPGEEEVNDFIRKHLFERSHYYSQAPVTINNENKSSDAIVAEIIETLF